MKIKILTTTAYHPQTNGALERTHSTLVDYLKHYITLDQTDWDSWLDFATFSFNTSVHSSTKFTPFELLFGIKPSLPSQIVKEPEFKYTYDNYIDDLRLKLQRSHHIARENLIKSKETNKTHYDKKSRPKTFNVGDNVYLENNVRRPRTSRKLTPNYTGPYKIVEINSPVNSTIQIKNKRVTVHNDRLKQ